MIRKAIFAAASLLAALSLAHAPAAAANLNIKDGTGTTQLLCAHTLSDGSLAECHVILDTSNAQIDPATKQLQQSTITTLGSPFQAGGAIANTSFGISGSLPAFAATPTFNLGTAPAIVIAAGTAQIGTVNTVVQGTATDIGATMVANTATTIAAINTSRRGFAIQNQTAGNCYLSGTATATADYHSLVIAAGAYYESKDSHVGTGALSVICASAGGLYGRQW